LNVAKDQLRQITLGYSPGQDRVWLADPDHAERLWLTYRMVRGFLKGATNALAKTREKLDVPWTPDEDEQLKLEKEEAAPHDWLGEGGDSGRKLGAATTTVLVTSIEVKVERKRFRVTLKADKIDRYTWFNRMEFHRFCRSLFHICNQAEWQLGDLPDWFRDDADLRRR
jgi:hypothetical protein